MKSALEKLNKSVEALNYHDERGRGILFHESLELTKQNLKELEEEHNHGSVKPFKGWPLPKGSYLLCSNCKQNIIHLTLQDNKIYFKCNGPESTCGKLLSIIDIENNVGQMIVEE